MGAEDLQQHPQPSADDTITILIATDNHLGYEERDPVRGQDSFHAFEEVMQIAYEKRVDMVLLGGDLFHENRPSRRCLHETLRILRKYALNDRPCALEFLSDARTNFGPNYDTVNYEDPNINIGIPIFTIHGNHDDPCGEGNLSTIDILAESRLVNYFGRATNIDKVSISPILLRKGLTYFALYGLGNIRDERLHRTFKAQNVVFERPQGELACHDWFNLFTIHQNRAPHGPTSYIPHRLLDDFLHLVVWGHEHQCIIDPEFSGEGGFYITQPGSSVATSLSDGESVAKHVGLLRIHKQEFMLEKIRLKNVRPFVMHSVSLCKSSRLYDSALKKGLERYLQIRINNMIEDARAIYKTQLMEGLPFVPANLGDDPKPLVRIRVEYTDELDSFYPHRFSLSFSDRVANPKDILLFYRSKAVDASKLTASQLVQKSANGQLQAAPAPINVHKVEDLVRNHLDSDELRLLIDMELGDAVKQYVDKGDTAVIQRYVLKSLDEVQKQLKRSVSVIDESVIEDELRQVRKTRQQKQEEKEEEEEEEDKIQHRSPSDSVCSTNQNVAADQEVEYDGQRGDNSDPADSDSLLSSTLVPASSRRGASRMVPDSGSIADEESTTTASQRTSGRRAATRASRSADAMRGGVDSDLSPPKPPTTRKRTRAAATTRGRKGAQLSAEVVLDSEEEEEKEEDERENDERTEAVANTYGVDNDNDDEDEEYCQPGNADNSDLDDESYINQYNTQLDIPRTKRRQVRTNTASSGTNTARSTASKGTTKARRGRGSTATRALARRGRTATASSTRASSAATVAVTGDEDSNDDDDGDSGFGSFTLKRRGRR